jgi:hypothetical protein
MINTKLNVGHRLLNHCIKDYAFRIRDLFVRLKIQGEWPLGLVEANPVGFLSIGNDTLVETENNTSNVPCLSCSISTSISKRH